MDRTYRLRAVGDDYTLDYSILVGFYADPLTAMRADGNEAPDDAHAGSFTFDGDDEDDGIIYFPLDPNLKVIVHEAAMQSSGRSFVGAFPSRIGTAASGRKRSSSTRSACSPRRS